MSVHQVITGALNKGESSFSIGSVDGINFIACAVGTDVVILAPNFQRVQIIPGNDVGQENVVSAVAAVYGSLVRIYEPNYSSAAIALVPFQWTEVSKIEATKPVTTIQWVLEGLRLLVMCSSELILYQNQLLSTAVKDSGSSVTFSISEEKANGWDVLWRTDLAFEMKFVKFSPDGTLFASCGENDNLVKVWYQQEEPYKDGQIHFSYYYLQHPAPVTGFEWRRTSRYMPRKCAQNAIITWCEDNISRIWKQTPKNDTQLENLIEAVDVVSKTAERFQKRNKSFRVKKARRKLVTKISDLINKEHAHPRRGSGSHASLLTRSATFADFAVPASTVDSLHFSLVATIDPDNDCYLVPSLNTGSNAPRQPFAIHWLNNKELMFALGAEKILADTILNDQFDTRSSSKAKSMSPNSTSGLSESEGDTTSDNITLDRPAVSHSPSITVTPSSTTQDIQLKDMLDTKLEGLMREWNHCVDVVFSVYPVDGSLLTWTIEWLDDTWRQPTVNFASRFPNAFPLTDAASLSLSLYSFNPYNPVYAEVAQRHSPDPMDPDTVDRLIGKQQKDVPKDTIHLLTSHMNGSLNLWDLTTEDNHSLTHILNIVHRSRMCGHRFHISKVVAHPVLPLLLTASQAAKKDESESARDSELILWKVSPVSPLCKSGGVRELARLNSNSAHAFDCLSWVPAILPSSTLGTVCNSPSSCFIASNHGKLLIYQAVVDARGLLAELYSSKVTRRNLSSSTESLDESAAIEASPDLCETFNVVSTQSTAKPGCVLFLGDVENSSHESSDMLMLHVFNEELTLNNVVENDEHAERNSLVIDRSRSATFSDNYFIVMVVRTATEDRLRMWSLTVASQLPVPMKNYVDDEEVKPDGDDFYPAAPTNPPSVAKLSITSKVVYDEPIELPSGVRVLNCVVAAGHLPSAGLYPACRAPYLLLLSCSDDHIRFLRCATRSNPDGTYEHEWNQWKMISDDIDSELELDGEIYDISAAHSGRFASAYRNGGSHEHRPGATLTEDLEVSVYECESSGGVEWLQEDTFRLDKYVTQTTNTRSLLESFRQEEQQGTLRDLIRRVVRLDWVSAEDGSHILTVGVGHTIYLFAQVSRDVAQQNIVMLKDNETKNRGRLRKASSLVGNTLCSNRLVRWMCLRTLELQSADGLPPLPTAMSWVRDGMLIIGLHSEMRIYNQWNPTSKASDNPKEDEAHSTRYFLDLKSSQPPTQKASINISRSHSMLEQLNKRAKLDTASGNKMMKDIMTKVLSAAIPISEMNTKDEVVLKALSEEGLFEASRLANPMLPQYHPKQLIEMLNSGKTKRVKAIFLHMIRTLKYRNASGSNALKRAASVRKLTAADSTSVDFGESQPQRLGEDETPEFEELDSIPPLPLYALLEADEAVSGDEKAANINGTEAYDGLFGDNDDEEDLDDVLQEGYDDAPRRTRSRHSSGNSIDRSGRVDIVFTARHCRILTEMLTHMQLPGLSSVDQMHLLSIADTLSHFSSSTIDRLIQANAGFHNITPSTVADSAAAGYANVSTGVESVDECGLRFLMAMKQHEYLLRCLPIHQRQQLKTKGLSTAHIIWAFHSDTETELLNAIPCCQRGQETWEELRSVGAAWWLKNTSTLKLCVEKMAKSAFQQKQEPLDASLYYLALRKKNVLTHLFRTVNDVKLAEFFREDFTIDRWKRAALKNAFMLMSKQRFHHAAAFFLLGNSLKDALQTIIRRLNDIQLAMVVLRLFEPDPERQSVLLTELLCNEVLGCDPSTVKHASVSTAVESSLSPSSRTPSIDPFERSMAFWLVKNYAKAASTLLEEANKASFAIHGGFTRSSLSDIFNLYSYLRRHPLVTRQRLTDSAIPIGSTEKFLQLARELESRVTPSERRLYFRTASVHMASGCPLLALDVLLRLPKKLGVFLPDDGDLTGALHTQVSNEGAGGVSSPAAPEPVQSSADFDWSAPSEVKEDELKLDWSDDDADADDEFAEKESIIDREDSILIDTVAIAATEEDSSKTAPMFVDFISQHLTFVAALRVFMEELSTLASGFEVDGGQLRFELFRWLEKECLVLRDICDYQVDVDLKNAEHSLNTIDFTSSNADIELKALAIERRRLWLTAHQKLIRTFTSYCALHSAQNHRLTSVLMELLLLLLELQQEGSTFSHRSSISSKAPCPFPLLVGSLSNCRMFLSSPLHFIENQSNDLLTTIAEFDQPLSFDLSLPKVYDLYYLCQGLSSCLYQALSDIDEPTWNQHHNSTAGILTRQYNSFAANDDTSVVSQPCRWPGVQSFISLLECEKDEDCPNLLVLIAECFTAITMSLFCYAFSLYDARWLYRLMAHDVNSSSFGEMFGGAGEHRLKPIPSRPPPPRPDPSPSSTGDVIRAKLHARVFGAGPPAGNPNQHPNSANDQVISVWVPPKKHIFQFFAEKVEGHGDAADYEYDSDDAGSITSADDEDDEYHFDPRPHDTPHSYAWYLIRLALAIQQQTRLKQFLQLLGIDINDLPTTSPKITKILALLDDWIEQLHCMIERFPGGCPAGFLPNPFIEPELSNQNAPLLRKYRSLIESGNTPFEYDEKGVLPVRRLWSYLVRQENLSANFIKYIFEKQGAIRDASKDASSTSGALSSTSSSNTIKIMHREQDPILAFACNSVKPSWIAVSNGREIQEISMESLFAEQALLNDHRTTYLNNRVALDIALEKTARDTLRDNDDYQILLDGKVKTNTSFLRKRQAPGVRRLEPHPSLPYYVSGSSDGSIFLWEWGLEQPIFTARSAGQYAKVTKLAFSLNGNKFAAVDGDGLLCMWQAAQSVSVRKPYFNQKCHTKAAADVKFLGQTSSLLVTVGHSSGDANVTLWDTLMPSSKATVHSFIGHPDGAMCVAYLPNSQTIVSGGRHGDVCLWDIRQRQLRTSIKAFDSASIVKALCVDDNGDYIIVGSSDGDLKVFNSLSNPTQLYNYTGEHAAKGGFSLRQVGIQGIQQLALDSSLRLFSCGADCSLKFRPLPAVVQTYA
uniref:WD_REPEATS_REGION domain-containing protein n=1 Tax=Panagrellus redivivus TaxID=6233 RepID=A0A7E4VLC2_PANRE